MGWSEGIACMLLFIGMGVCASREGWGRVSGGGDKLPLLEARAAKYVRSYSGAEPEEAYPKHSTEARIEAPSPGTASTATPGRTASWKKRMLCMPGEGVAPRQDHDDVGEYVFGEGRWRRSGSTTGGNTQQLRTHVRVNCSRQLGHSCGVNPTSARRHCTYGHE